MNKYVLSLERNLLLLGKLVMPKAFWAPSPPLHYEVESLLLDPAILRTNIILPRGTAKTVLAGELKPLHHLFVESYNHKTGMPDPRFVVIVSKTQAHSINRLSTIKEILEYSPEFINIFGRWGQESAIIWRNDMIILKNGSIILTRGMGQPIRGLNIYGLRPTLIVLDDPEDENNTKTPEAMEDNLRWVLQAAIPALDEKFGTSKLIVIGTPLNQRCIVETLAEMENWFTIRRSYINYDEEGNVYSIWPEKKSAEDLLAEKADLEKIGRGSIWWKERQCILIGDEDQLFKDNMIKYWDGELSKAGEEAILTIRWTKNSQGDYIDSEPRDIPVNVFMGVDPASSTKQTADYSVIFPIAVDAERNIYCLPYFRKRVKPFDLGDAILRYYEMNKPKTTRIESTGYQEMLREYVQRESEKKGIWIPGLELKEMPRNSKSSRLEALEPLFVMGKVYLKEDMQEFKTELLMFPRGKNDDTLDGFFFAQKHFYEPYHQIGQEEDDDIHFSYGMPEEKWIWT